MPRPRKTQVPSIHPRGETMPPPDVHVGEEEDQGDVSNGEFASALGALASVFSAKAIGKAEKKKALEASMKQIAAALDEYPELVKDPAVWAAIEKIEDVQRQSGGDELAPGSMRKINEFMTDKVDWNWRHLKECPKEYRPDGAKYGQPLPRNTCEWVYGRWCPETMPVTWNGLQVVMLADHPYNGPKFFWDVYEGALRQRRAAFEHASYLFNGASIPPSDPTIVTTESQAVRAKHHRIPGLPNGFLPGAGGAQLVGARTAGEGAADGDTEG